MSFFAVCVALHGGLLQSSCSVVRRLTAYSHIRNREQSVSKSHPVLEREREKERGKRVLRTVHAQVPSRAGKGDGGPFKVFRHLDLAP